MRFCSMGLLVGVLIVLILAVAGCGGGSNGQVPVTGGGTAKTAGATYVGTAVCETCHSDIGTQFTMTAHGQDFSQPVHGINFMTDHGGACQACHVVGLDQPGGFVSPTATPQLIGIGCEDCHGPGSKHAGAPSADNINLIPDSTTTCFDCHVSEYQMLRQNPGALSDADLYSTVPDQVNGPHHPQALELLGVQAVDVPVTPSPHSLISNTCVACHLNPDQGSIVLDPTIKGTYGNLTIPSGANPIHGQGALAVDTPTCVACHGSASAAQSRYASHKTELINDLIAIGGDDGTGNPDTTCSGGLFKAFVTRHSIDITTNNSPHDTYVKLYKAARWDYEYLISDGSYGTHNPRLSDAIIAQCQAWLSE